MHASICLVPSLKPCVICRQGGRLLPSNCAHHERSFHLFEAMFTAGCGHGPHSEKQRALHEQAAMGLYAEQAFLQWYFQWTQWSLPATYNMHFETFTKKNYTAASG